MYLKLNQHENCDVLRFKKRFTFPVKFQSERFAEILSPSGKGNVNSSIMSRTKIFLRWPKIYFSSQRTKYCLFSRVFPYPSIFL